ncbi:MAG: hypothetical protein P8179_02365 [Candidatus Thiodiazotropha sp.]
MLFYSLNLTTIGARFDEIASTVASVNQKTGMEDPDHSPAILQQSMHRLVELLIIMDKQTSSTLKQDAISYEELNELGDYGFNLLMDFSALANQLKLTEQSLELEDLTLPLALWLVRHHGEIRTLEPVVNALARLANTFSEPAQLQQLHDVNQEILSTIHFEKHTNQSHETVSQPWRILLINHAIIATRTYQPALIEQAYETLTLHFPEEAPDFFREGMAQMDALNYPQQVREVVEKYYNLWSLPRTLH